MNVYKNKVLLEKLYLRKRMSIREIAEKFNVDSSIIWYHLLKFKIPRRKVKSKPKEKFKITKKILEKLYYKKKLTTKDIANRIGTTHKTILLKMIKYGIPRRTKSEFMTKYPKMPFSGNLMEKAYLIGLRTGDFSAKKHRNLIRLDTSSLKSAQIKMTKKVFEKYTKVNIVQDEIYFLLHPSFEFLLKKLRSLPTWILKNKQIFFSFLAGYSDCEGSWTITKGRKSKNSLELQFRISSCDKIILRQLNKMLIEFEFNSHFNLSRRKGEKTNVGKYTRNLYSVVIYRTSEVTRLAKILLLLSKHQDKINKMNLILNLRK